MVQRVKINLKKTLARGALVLLVVSALVLPAFCWWYIFGDSELNNTVSSAIESLENKLPYWLLWMFVVLTLSDAVYEIKASTEKGIPSKFFSLGVWGVAGVVFAILVATLLVRALFGKFI